MGHLVQSVVMHILLLLSIFSISTMITPPQSDTVLPISPARELDTLLQGYAYKVFVYPKTGVSYDATLPSNLTGIRVSAMRLKSGSLYTRGVEKYKEFEFPKGITTSPYVERLVLVYQNLGGNWSKTYYDLPGYTYLSPVIGFLAYDAFNLSATNLPELSVRVSGDPIAVHFNISPPSAGSVPPKCVSINLNGSVAFSSAISGNICMVRDQGHFSLAAVSPPPPPKKSNTKAWIIVGSVLGVLVMLGLLVLFVKKYTQKKKMERMERAAESGEDIDWFTVDDTRLPFATGTRTQPVLEEID